MQVLRFVYVHLSCLFKKQAISESNKQVSDASH